MKKIVTALAVVTAVVALGAGATSATAADAPAQPSLVDAVAAKLGVTPEQVRAAFKSALTARVDAAVAAGTLTPEQAAKLRERITDANGLGLGAKKAFGKKAKAFKQRLVVKAKGLGSAGEYLGLTREALRSELRSGKSLAQVAVAQGKSLEGLIDAMTQTARDRLAKAVTAKKLTQARADELSKALTERIGKLVQRQLPPKTT